MNFTALARATIAELEQVLERINHDEIQQTVTLLAPAKRIFLAGVGREGLSTRAFAMRLMHLGKETHWIWDDTTPGILPGDLVIITTGSGEIGHLHYVAQRAKSAGGTLLVVSGARDRITTTLADCRLWVPAAVYRGTDDVVPSAQPMGCLFEQAWLITADIIVMLLKERLGLTSDFMESRHRNVE